MAENSAGWDDPKKFARRGEHLRRCMLWQIVAQGGHYEVQTRMRERFYHVIEEYRMIEPGEKVIAGVSGGADSVCLLHLLCQLREKIPFSLVVVHVEHGLRGQESLDDAAFVENLCEKWQVPRRVVHVNVEALSFSEGMSCEEAGRAARYRIFEETAVECKARRIAVAHNQNDQAETVLWNLARGSGLKGLGGIRPVQGKLIRPLLFFCRDEIEEYLRAEGLSWRTDRTNLEPEFTRNRIRLSLLPQMEQELNRQSTRHIAEAAGRLQRVQEYLDQMTDAAAARCIWCDGLEGGQYSSRQPGKDVPARHSEMGQYPASHSEMEKSPVPKAGESGDCFAVNVLLEPFRKKEPLIQEELLKRAVGMCASGMKDIGAVHLDMLKRLADMDCGKKMDLPGGIRAEREDQVLRISRRISRPQGEDAARRGISRPQGEDAARRGISRPQGEDAARRGDASPITDRFAMGGTKETPCGENIDAETEADADGMILPVPGILQIGGFSLTAELVENSPDLKRKILEENQCTKWFSCDTIKNSLRVRHRKPGDYLVVNAQGGTKKLNDYFADQKIPARMRDEIWLLADGSHILWVIGYRISEAAKVRVDTRYILKCTYQITEIGR
ncbi:MAG: tRNA lysidine(34) synthetase TilS [Lachnospiraceae bacterium]|nr:tRNA lysidine(34) synthetase TilS [Lachnospiraceae bacterium]